MLGRAQLVKLNGDERALGAGESVQIPAGCRTAITPPARRRGTSGPSCSGVARRGAARAARRARCRRRDHETKVYPKPLAAAHLIREFPAEGRAARPPPPVQRASPAPSARVAGSGGEYVFVDEWDVVAPPEAVFDLIADARTYPSWWRPVYIDVESDGEPRLGAVSQQHFKGRLPYHLRTSSTVTVYDPPHQVGAEVVGDLRGRGLWTLTPTETGTHVRFDWSVFADKPVLHVLTPVLRPAFRWNHAWAIARAQEGLEPAARARS